MRAGRWGYVDPPLGVAAEVVCIVLCVLRVLCVLLFSSGHVVTRLVLCACDRSDATTL